jgi:dethiobiotin synthetase
MKDIFITATNTNVGKTYTTLQLIRMLSEKGLEPGVFKPIETGVNKYPVDATILLEGIQKVNKKFHKYSTKDICPLQFPLPAAPFVAAGGEKIHIDPIIEKYHLLKTSCDVLLIEGAGGLLVPVNEDYFISDLIALFDATTLLVTHDKLGCINDTLLNLFYLEEKKIDFSWCVNLRDPEDFLKTTHPFYNTRFPGYYTVQHDLEKIVDQLLLKISK